VDCPDVAGQHEYHDKHKPRYAFDPLK
jgi:hypothetical protein